MTTLNSSLEQINATISLGELEDLRAQLLGKKGYLSEAMRQLGTLAPEERKSKGEELNSLKEEWLAAFSVKKKNLEAEEMAYQLAQEKIDVTLPVAAQDLECGRRHPIGYVIDDLVHLFEKMGFSLREGPDIEDDFHNFTALNIPSFHPARTTHDTFYLKSEAGQEKLLLRTHTSPVQIRTLCQEKPPLRIIVPGRVFRADYDQTHTPMFHQIEGLVIDQGIHMGHLKGCLEEFFQFFFEKPVPLRFRPSFFPFTEPSAEVDILCDRRSNAQLKIGCGDDWLEILGCGMVHPKVIENCGLDPQKHQGFAFGMGVERLAMLKYGIPDLRRFFENDTRWLAHYGLR